MVTIFAMENHGLPGPQVLGTRHRVATLGQALTDDRTVGREEAATAFHFRAFSQVLVNIWSD